MKYIGTYSHNGQIGVMVEIQAQMVGFNGGAAFLEECVSLGQDIAMHVAVNNPADIAELLSQAFVKNPNQSVLELLIEKSKPSDNTISVSRFIRWDTSTPDTGDDPSHDPAMAMKVKRN